ncbi:hypothetical protein [Streptomyces fructofermentans]|uniref:hypothetical protein n=1 Tax=Streptomyces fructofermentans TaxID=152141 RepID=UPI00378A2B3D
MSRQRKGRRHRKVDMTPRPVGPARSKRAAAPVTEPRAAAAEAPAVPPQQAGAGTDEALSRRVSESGLSRNAVRTWQELAGSGTAGRTAEELSAVVGYQPSTVVKHLKGLADQGLAELHEDVWRAVGAPGGGVVTAGP